MKPKKDILLYVHIPFCNSKCRFCYWVVNIPKKELLAKSGSDIHKNYVEALIQQIRFESQRLGTENLQPKLIYFGGGTPGVLDNHSLTQIFKALDENYDLSAVEDITFESTPETLDLDKLRNLKNLGFTRISTGAQSFNDNVLKFAGRLHTKKDIYKAVDNCIQAGFTNINIDLIAGLPKEDFDQFKNNIHSLLELPLNHASIYTFRATPETGFYNDIKRNRSPHINYNDQVLFYHYAQELLTQQGFEEYSFYYFGKNGAQSRACMNYFNMNSDWLGFGAGATSLIDGQFKKEAARVPDYIENLNHLEWTSASDTNSLNLLFANAITTPGGIRFTNWKNRGITDFNALEKDHGTRSSLDFLRAKKSLIEDENGLRIPQHILAETNIRMTEHLAQVYFGKNFEKPSPKHYLVPNYEARS